MRMAGNWPAWTKYPHSMKSQWGNEVGGRLLQGIFFIGIFIGIMVILVSILIIWLLYFEEINLRLFTDEGSFHLLNKFSQIPVNGDYCSHSCRCFTYHGSTIPNPGPWDGTHPQPWTINQNFAQLAFFSPSTDYFFLRWKSKQKESTHKTITWAEPVKMSQNLGVSGTYERGQGRGERE